MEWQVHLVKRDHRATQDPLVFPGSRDREDHRVLLGHQDLMDQREQLGNLAKLDTKVSVDPKACREVQVTGVTRVTQGQKANGV